MKEEKTNIQKLGDDIKGVAFDVVNSEAVKNVKDKLSEAADSELAQKAKQVAIDAANSEVAQKAKAKLAEAANSEFAKAAKERIDAAANSETAKCVKGKFSEEFSNAKAWASTNWNGGGYGKFRVVAAVVIILLAVRGLFALFGTSDAVKVAEIQKESAEMEAGAAMLGALLGGGGSSQSSSSSHSSGPKLKTWVCRQCGNQIQSVYNPPRPKCKAYHGQRDGSCRDKCDWMEVH